MTPKAYVLTKHENAVSTMNPDSGKWKVHSGAPLYISLSYYRETEEDAWREAAEDLRRKETVKS